MDAHAPNSLDLFIGNLKLLNYDIQDANQIFRMQLSEIDASLYYNCQNIKLVIHTVHFLLQIICINEAKEFDNHFRIYYPPRTLQEQSDYKKEFIEYIRRLERVGKIPKNFQYTKTILDEKFGLRQIKFLRFLSEFALRYSFINRFPQIQLKTFYPNPRDLMLGDNKHKSTFNDLADIFAPASFQLEGINGIQMEKCSIDNETIYQLIGLVKNQFNVQLNKLNKIFVKNIKFIDNVKYIVDYLVESNTQIRKELINLNQRQEEYKSEINPKNLGKDRQLDRIPLMDTYMNTFKHLRGLMLEYRRMRIDEKVFKFNNDFDMNDQLSRLDKKILGLDVNGFIDLNEEHGKITQQLCKVQGEVNNMKNKSWLIDTSNKLMEDSDELLQQLKKFKSQNI